MRIDRLVGITMHLLGRGTVSAAALAQRFEVSRRTIQRDVDALCRAGMPIVATHGVQGGYAMVDGFGPAKQIGGAADYANILTALQGLRSAYPSRAVEATLDRALAALHGGEQRVFLDFGVAREGQGIDALLPELEQVIREKTPLRIAYEDANGLPTQRTVEPLALSYQWYAWYLFAFCSLRQEYRLFKLARILRCDPASGMFSREHGDVEQLMRSQPRDERRCWDVRLLCRSAVRRQALEYLNGEIIQELENGDCVLRLTAPMERMWFSLLLGFGNQVQVLEPDELRQLLRQRAGEVVSLYSET